MIPDAEGNETESGLVFSEQQRRCQSRAKETADPRPKRQEGMPSQTMGGYREEV